MKPRHPSISDKEKHQKGKFAPRAPKSRKEGAEFGPGKVDIVMCKNCDAVYYEKSWHHSLEDYWQLSQDKRVKFVICPACQMIKDKKYEGVVTLENVPQKREEEILRLVRNVAERAFKRDPMDRIIHIDHEAPDGKSTINIFTTENQLAVSIGKQIKRAFKEKLDIQWSHQESTVRVRISF